MSLQHALASPISIRIISCSYHNNSGDSPVPQGSWLFWVTQENGRLEGIAETLTQRMLDNIKTYWNVLYIISDVLYRPESALAHIIP